MNKFKGDFINVLICTPSDSRFSNSCNILSYPNKPQINEKLIYSAFR